MSFRRAPIERIGQMHVTPRHFRRVCDCLRYPGFIAAPLVVIGLLSVAPASAAPPAHSLPDPIVLPGSGPGVDGYCDGFTVVVTFTKYKQQVVQDTTVGDFQTLKFTGNAQATVTREDDPKKSVNYNVSGPGTIVTNLVDGSFSADAHGPNLLWTTKANSFPGVPQISYTTGHVTFAVGPPPPENPEAGGKTTSYNLAGRQTDVCAVLAA
jgi:hypothetical protein